MSTPFVNPTPEDFQNYFTRDFPYSDSVDSCGNCDGVLDSDIQKAIDQASFNFNPALVSTQAEYTILFLWLTAHYLVVDLRASSQGIAGQYSWLTASKGVGSVNESYSIPQKILDHPVYAMYSKTNYGAKFLSLILPRLTGVMFSVHGTTHS